MENRYHELAKKWLNNTITPAEQAEFAAWYNKGQDNPIEIPPTFAENDEALKQRILNKINREIKKDDSRVKKIMPMWLRYAASILLFAGCFICYYLQTHRAVKSNVLTQQQKPLKNDAGPGGNKAILTLANGSKINLSDVKNGVLASQGQTVLKKDKDGRIIYEVPGAKGVDSSAIFNTITTPRGGQFQVVLSDGSKVWLNSASSITFPAAFSKTERKVTITGEAYFEIAKNKNKPFKVVTGRQIVEVLGTHFNINAYTDESAIKTTLIEGSVKISADAQTAILKPEQQSSLFNNKISINTVDTDNVLAWTTGNFQFEKAEIPSIMREAARWYDVDIKYEGEIPKRRFTGSISRSVNLSELLKMLKYTGINFKIAGKTIVVTS
ncbi:FecR family protein [Mucilaginibacter flavidus]|uniref:FecR family protein n=1 Tax=Mucilaginibacter flavidus TaxID=2949309 RepID=UPI002092A184|nr:FecR family protein [Mucilaginibacter flavidus]MCO5949003.1 FecR family protein [Mucilaginibacter flavidus]